jgi:N-acetylglucosaminyl-diphospho-decaprenol L-rhamnosyltransferase
MRRIDAPFVVVANPDVTVSPGATERLVAALISDRTLALAGPTMLDADGSLLQTARAFPSIRRSGVQALAGVMRPGGRAASAYRARNWQRAEERYVDWVSGAFFVVRRNAFEAVGGFDERYFMYVEEVDLCWRLARAGWKVAYVKEAVVTHVGGVSGATHPYLMIVSHHRSLWRFAQKTSTGVDVALLPVVALGIGARLLVACAQAWWRRTRSR